jgi:hypothetical protein
MEQNYRIRKWINSQYVHLMVSIEPLYSKPESKISFKIKIKKNSEERSLTAYAMA